jgi:hypothetical protein
MAYRFLRLLDQTQLRPTEDDVQLGRCMWSVDNDATRKHRVVRAWLTRRPRIRLDFSPAVALWINASR